MRLPP
ncbi:hypothetical protein ECTW00353_5163, partial [Escherichia coli TW00353]